MERLLAEAFGQDADLLATKEKQQLLSRLLGRLAHEIRNPLSSLDIHFQLLDEDIERLAPDTREQMASRMEIIHCELRRLENVVKHFLHLSNPLDLELGPVELRQIIEHVCGLLRPEAAAREIDLKSRIEEPLPVLTADAHQLIQVLMNLVINALQAVNKRGWVEVVACWGQKSEVAIEVRDSGPGISSEKQSMVFEPYFTTKSEGSGLGLWIAQQISIAHGGSIRAGNDPQTGGAVFTLKIPVQHPEAAHG